MPSDHPALTRAEPFRQAYNIRVPILQAPMAGACPASLAIAVANAGGLGGSLGRGPRAVHAVTMLIVVAARTGKVRLRWIAVAIHRAFTVRARSGA